MPDKKEMTGCTAPSGSAGDAGTTLVDVARTVGSTLGTAAAKAEGAAKDLEKFSQAVRKSTLATTRKLYKHVKKSLHARAPRPKTSAKKTQAGKKQSGKKSGGRGQ
ncbi:MAG TPA: hypothetical protein VG028_16885 [Terriglobia bacterium]|nr:hypothetical protein [Terriglobia bacterium]